MLEIFRETLREMNLSGEVFATDMSRSSPAFHMADRSIQVPRCTDEDFVPRMLDICRENAVSLVIPTIDTELCVLSANKKKFEDIGTIVAISSPDTIAISSDKDSTHKWLVDGGFPTVKQVMSDELLREGKDSCGELSFPLLVKPLTGSASIGVTTVKDKVQLEAATEGDVYIAQTIAAGVEYTVDVFVNSYGKALCAVPRKRLEVRAGEVSKGMTVRSEDLQDLARRIAQALPGAFGILNIQIFLDKETGEMNVIEINPRFGGGFPLAWKAGADYPCWLIQEVLGRECGASWGGWRDRLVMLRYDDAVFVDADKIGL
ncbi:MAG: ATP-grasp domain-containing protein [Deltaproteobacteria bacterium]|nr:ATP-grasp domain-containing protein [Deltaproteobacteria bacterium]